jgi:nucleotide-binding universal stress UspA family protein
MKYNKIMISFEDNKHDHEVLKHAMDITERNGGTLTLLHINSNHAGYPSRAMRPLEHAFTEEELQKIVDEIPHNVPVIIELIKTDRILDTVVEKAVNFDLLVMGHRHANFFETLFGESLDERVINKVDCDVLVVKQSD